MRVSDKISLLDMDETIIELLDKVELSRTPFNDIKECAPDCDLGLIEGGVCNTENIEVLKHFRKNCKIIIAVGGHVAPPPDRRRCLTPQ